MTEQILDLESPIFSFSEAVDLAGVDEKQLRNFLQDSRGILRVGAKDEQGRWRFTIAEVVQINIVSDLNKMARVSPQAGAEIARAANPIIIETLDEIARSTENWVGWEILCRFLSSHAELDAHARGFPGDGTAIWRPLTEAAITEPVDVAERPPIASSSHLVIPIDEMVVEVARAANRSRSLPLKAAS